MKSGPWEKTVGKTQNDYVPPFYCIPGLANMAFQVDLFLLYQWMLMLSGDGS